MGSGAHRTQPGLENLNPAWFQRSIQVIFLADTAGTWPLSYCHVLPSTSAWILAWIIDRSPSPSMTTKMPRVSRASARANVSSPVMAAVDVLVSDESLHSS